MRRPPGSSLRYIGNSSPKVVPTDFAEVCHSERRFFAVQNLLSPTPFRLPADSGVLSFAARRVGMTRTSELADFRWITLWDTRCIQAAKAVVSLDEMG